MLDFQEHKMKSGPDERRWRHVEDKRELQHHVSAATRPAAVVGAGLHCMAATQESEGNVVAHISVGLSEIANQLPSVVTTVVISQCFKWAETALEERRNGATTADVKRRRAERFGIPAGTSTNYNISLK